MIRMIVTPLFVMAAAAGAQECVYKSVMSAEEISACRDAPPPPEDQKMMKAQAPPPRTSKQQAEYEARVAQENARFAAQKQAAEADARIPLVPVIGMTAEDAHAMVEANRRRLSADVDHGVKPADWRYIKWTMCHVNRTTTARGVHEQWVCEDGAIRSYLYFDNGVLTSIQE